MGKKHFCFFQTAETGNRTPNSGVKGSGANHYPRAPRPVVDEDDLQWVKMKKKIIIFLKQLHEKNRSKPSGCRKLSRYSDMQNYALMHREGLKG